MRPFVLLLSLSCGMWAAGPEFDQARKLYNLTEFEQSLKILRAIPQKDGMVYDLIGRNYYMQGDFKKATDALEKPSRPSPATPSSTCGWGALTGGGRRLPTCLRLRAMPPKRGSVSKEPRN